MFQNKTLMLLMLAFAAMLLTTPAHAALSCGQVVTGAVTLTANLVCSGPGLIVGADNTTIDLNGFKLSCSGGGGGYLGSCQNSLLTPQPLPLSIPGITSNGFNNVTVHGPGTIWGFGEGVKMLNGNGLGVIGVTISGPVEPVSVDFISRRLLSVGVVIAQTKCSIGILALGYSATVEYNDVSNVTQGVQVSSASCVLVSANYLHDTSGAYGDTHGIDVIAAGNNTISSNIVMRNGNNQGLTGGVDGGIMLLNSGSNGNLVFQNYVADNCGDGITARNGAQNNNIFLNFSYNNSVSTQGGKCVFAPIGSFFDVSDRAEGPGNTWNKNNSCKSQSAGIPAGVCP
jgi:hypothetical protein